MDPNVQSILLGLFANGLTSLIARQYTDGCVKAESGILELVNSSQHSNQEDTNGSPTQRYRNRKWKSRGV
jgi:hypothetical protein